MDVNGKFALNCRNEIFKGLHIIFVESGYNNYYFNYAHACNMGIKKAMEYNPKWIIVSNDDIEKIYPIELLIKELNNYNNLGCYIIFTRNRYVNPKLWLCKKGLLSKLWEYFLNVKNKKPYFEQEKKIMKKFNINYVLVLGWPRFFYKKIETLINDIGPFCVFKNSPIIFGDFSSSGLFDETFINGSEDVFLSFELQKKI
jgi:GT2 family glycosyltransferase